MPKILVVDDNEQLSSMLKDVLESWGYTALTATEGRSDGRTHSIAVIMMTALEDMESRIHGYKVGADNFLVKPINYNEVKAIIQKLLKEKLYEDTLEESCNVAKAFRKFGQLLLGQPVNINAPNMVYCNKLLESLNWDWATAKKDKPDSGTVHFPDGRTVS